MTPTEFPPRWPKLAVWLAVLGSVIAYVGTSTLLAGVAFVTGDLWATLTDSSTDHWVNQTNEKHETWTPTVNLNACHVSDNPPPAMITSHLSEFEEIILGRWANALGFQNLRFVLALQIGNAYKDL